MEIIHQLHIWFVYTEECISEDERRKFEEGLNTKSLIIYL